MIVHDAKTPLYMQVKDSLEKRIVSGVYPKGSKIPSEKMLCEEFGVSRITVRQALDLLESVGLTTPVHGKGTFVNTNKLDSPLKKIRSFSEMLSGKGYHGYTKIDLYEQKPVTAGERLLYGWDDETVSHLHLTGFSAGDPIVTYQSVIRGKFGEKMYARATSLEKDGIPFSTFDLYALVGIEIGDIRQQILAVNASEEIASLLNLPVGAAVLVLDSVILDKQGQSIEHKSAYYRTDKYSFTLTREV